jgi:hypothetical protein
MVQYKVILLLAAVGAGLLVQPVHAHGFGERYDLPVPLSYFLAGGAAAVILSFVIIGVAARGEAWHRDYPRLNLLRYSWVRVALSRPALLPVKLMSVMLLGLVVATGLFGDTRPVDNFAPTFVWVIWWVGLGFFVALLGNLWALINPWKIIYGWAEALYERVRPGRDMGLNWEYPQNLGIWPAVVLFFAFAWAENAFGESADPRRLAAMAISYSAISLGGMFIFGKHQWLRHGEAFSVVFGFLSRFSITEVRVTEPEVCRDCDASCEGEGGRCVDCYECWEYADRREFNLRPLAVGLNNPGRVTGDVTAMVLLILATVTFDGFGATPEWLEVQNYFINLFPNLTSEVLNGLTIANTLGLIGVPATFAVFYLSFAYLMHQMVGKRTGVAALAMAFVFSLIPIALAYNFAHFLSFLLIQGQQIIPLASDPFGAGWDLFGTADYVIDIGVINARFVWFFSVVVIVAGHVIAVYLAHVRAMRLFSNRSLVVRSQLPMLGLMVLYTVVSLWIISRPIVE